MSEHNGFESESVLLRVRQLVKQYPGVLALDHVDFDVRAGEVHCLVGENGAGKSTLIEVIGGSIQKDSGTIEHRGQRVDFSSPKETQDAGIAILHQELPVLPDMTVAENICMSRLPTNKLGMVSYPALYREASHWLRMIDSEVNPRSLLRELPVAKQQLVSIAKALSLEANIIVFDEPSAVLTAVEIEHLFKIIHTLREDGRGIVYISHRLDEVFEIGDRFSVLRNGKKMATDDVSKVTETDLVRYMVGRDMVAGQMRAGQQDFSNKEVLLAVRNISRAKVFDDVSFDLRKGEILGVFGLVGAGRTEVARAIIGADKIDSGEIEIGGFAEVPRSPKAAIAKGVCLAPEDRKRQGLLLDKSIRENVVLPSLTSLSWFGLLLSMSRSVQRARIYSEKLRIVSPSIETRAGSLSGGNQQKVVLAKWLSKDMQIFIFDEPTRGIDVGAKEEIRKLIIELADRGKGIIVISSEIPEILRISDRILVMHAGKIVAEVPVSEATEEKLLSYAMGSSGE
jgi:ribose transport system ATP-binding protein